MQTLSKTFNLDLSDIEETSDYMTLLDKAIARMTMYYDREMLEVVINEGLVDVHLRLTGDLISVCGCKVRFDNLPRDVSFMVKLRDTEVKNESEK